MSTPAPDTAAVVYRGRSGRIAGNPCLSALPAPRSTEEWQELLAQSLSHADLSHQELEDTELRIAETEQVIVPLPRAISLAKNMERLLRQGYDRRYPAYSRTFKELTVERQATLAQFGSDAPPKGRGTSKALSLIGASGSGKTSAIQGVLRAWTQVISHPLPRPGNPVWHQLVWLCVEAPPRRGEKGLFLSLLSAFDEALGTTLWKSMKSHSADVLEQEVADLVAKHAVGMIVIDEFQHLKGRGVSRSSLIMSLVKLMNSVRVPLVFVGTSDAEDVLAAIPSITKRTHGFHHAWNPLPCNKFFTVLVKGKLAPHQLALPFVRGADESTEVKQLHAMCAGVPAYLTTLLSAAQLDAAGAHRETFSMLDVDVAFEELPESTKLMIRAIHQQHRGIKSPTISMEDPRPVPGFDTIRKV
jgi:hypothetical protein